MKMSLALSTLLLASFWLTAGATEAADKTVHVTGYLMDEMCAGSSTARSGGLAYAKEHTKECSLAPSCNAQGFEVFSNGRWYQLDKNGSAQALKLLKTSKVEKGNYVEVDGTMTNGKLVVSQIKEIPAPVK